MTLDRRIRRLREAGEHDAAISVLEAAVSHPAAAAHLWIPELLEEIAELHALAGRYDEAIASEHRAIAAGLVGNPDPRASIAGFLLQAGRYDEALGLYEQLRHETPDDVWLYNVAGFDLHDAGRLDDALAWTSAGLQLALATGDPEGLVDQLADLRRRLLVQLPHQGQDASEADEPPDELDASARAFLSRQALEARRKEAVRWVAESAQDARKVYFPLNERHEALARWPHLSEVLGGSDEDYRFDVERRLRRFADAGATGLTLVPIDVAGLLAHTAAHRLDPGTPEARESYAAEVARRGHTTPWPPPRNGPCWCGSGAKYKKCCGSARARKE